MREYFTYGSVRGATGNGGPYRDPHGQKAYPFERAALSRTLSKSDARPPFP